MVGGYQNTDKINKKMEQIIYLPIITFKKGFNGKLFLYDDEKFYVLLWVSIWANISKFNKKTIYNRDSYIQLISLSYFRLTSLQF